jgi:hypothetical protein
MFVNIAERAGGLIYPNVGLGALYPPSADFTLL